MQKKTTILILAILMLSTIVLYAERSIECSVTTSSQYTPGETSNLIFQVSFDGGQADEFSLTFPQGFTPNSGTNMLTENPSISGRTIKWGTLPGWTGSGDGPLYGDQEIIVNVSVESEITANQTVEVDVYGDDPWEMDHFETTVVVSQSVDGALISIDNNILYFEAVSINATHTANLIVNNLGTSDLIISEINGLEDTPFSIDDFSSAIASNENGTLTFNFSPTEIALYENNITIVSNGGNFDLTFRAFALGTDYVSEGFENGFPPLGWQNSNDDWTTSDKSFDGEVAANLGYYDEGLLITPNLSIQDGDKLFFNTRYEYAGDDQIDIQFSQDLSTWESIAQFDLEADYRPYEVDLSSYAGTGYFGFTHTESRKVLLDGVHFPQINNNSAPSIPELLAPENNITSLETNTNLSWNETYLATGYYLNIGSDEEATNVLDNFDVENNLEYSIENLDYATTYYWFVTAYNEFGATQSETFSFTTHNNPIISDSHSENFDSYLPDFWTEAKGMLTENVTFESESSAWGSKEYNNTGDNLAAAINVYGTLRRDWLITPSIDLGDGSQNYKISFNYSITEFNETSYLGLAEDDKFAVVISTDNGETWSSDNTLREWNSSNQIANNDNLEYINLSGYTDLVKIGFYAESTVNNNDLHLFIDNFMFEEAEDSAEFVSIPSEFDFEDMNIGNSTDFETFVISNIGTGELIIESIETTDDFEIVCTADFPVSLQGTTLNVNVRFTPETAGQKNDQLIFNTNLGQKTADLIGYAHDENVTYESFEGENFPPEGWLVIDNDGDERSWSTWSGTYARTGEYFIKSNSESMFGDLYNPDNWLISPQLSVRENDKLVYFVRPMNPEYPGDVYEVKVSTTDTSLESFETQVYTEEIGPEIWVRREIDLSSFAGQNIYIAFHHFLDGDTHYAVCFDDMFLPPLNITDIPDGSEVISPENDSENINTMMALKWTASSLADGYKLSVGTDNPPTNILANEDIGNKTSYLFTELNAQTTYYWSVTPYNENGDANNSAVWNFTTSDEIILELPTSEEFLGEGSYPRLPIGWARFDGIYLNGSVDLQPVDFFSWAVKEFANEDTENQALYAEIDGDNTAKWIVTPTINVDEEIDSLQVRFDLALTHSGNSNADVLGNDDRVILFVSYDNGVTWTDENILKIWNSSSEISNSGQSVRRNFENQSSQIRFAFYAESTVDNNDVEIFVDNFRVSEPVNSPSLSAFPESANFDLTQVNNFSNPKNFRLTNAGIDTLFIQNIEIWGPDAANFILSDTNSYPFEITTNELNFNVRFNPVSAGSKTAFIHITDQFEIHEIEISGYAYGVNGDTTDDPFILEIENGYGYMYASTSGYSDDYLMPYDVSPTDSSDVVVKVSFTQDVIANFLISEMSWDSQMAICSADMAPEPQNYLYFNDDAEEMSVRKTGEARNSRGYNSMISGAILEAGEYFIIIDGSNKTGWFENHGEFRLDVYAYHFAAPENLVSQIDEENKTVDLTWDVPTISDGELTGYVLIQNGFVESELITETSYTHKILPGFDYDLAVIAVYDNPAGYSGLSNIVPVSFGDFSETLFSDDFESYNEFSIDFEPWTLLNQDGALNFGIQDIEWDNFDEPYAFMIFNPLGTTPEISHPDLMAYSGSQYAVHFLSENVENNDWLITPKINLGTESTLDFMARTFTDLYGFDNFKVGISTTDTNPESFTFISNSIEEAPDNWKNFIYDLSDYDNQSVYISINVVGSDGFIFMLDNFNVRSNGGSLDNENNVLDILSASLNQNYPNPFNPVTNINFSIPKESRVKLDVYNVKGQKVTTLVDDQLEEGNHSVIWEGQDANDKKVSSGIYFYRLKVNRNVVDTKKCILLK